jgi:hypothetical protein
MRTTVRALALLLALAVAATAAAQTTPLKVFTADLSPQNVVPPVHTGASGFAVAVLDGRQLDVLGSFLALSSPVAREIRGGAHIHQGGPSDNGPILYSLNVDGTVAGSIRGSFTLSDAQVKALEAGDLYVQIHSEQHKPGEMRAQLVPFTPGR